MQPFLAGKSIKLCGLTRVQTMPGTPYYGWLDDLSLDLYSERSYFPNSESRMEGYVGSAAAGKFLLLGIFDADCDRHIGNITIHDIDWINRRGFLGYLIGDKEFTGRGMATEACLMILYFAFHKLNLDRIWTTVSVDNAGSLKVAQKAGLQQEGILRGHQMRNGARYDLAVFGTLRGEWMAERGDLARSCFTQMPV